MPLYRPATLDDVPALCVLGQVVNLLHHQAWPHIFAGPSAPERDRDHWRQCVVGENGSAFVAEESSTVVGFVTVSVTTEGNSLMQPMRFARIGSVCVAAASRGQGIGSRLMACAEEWAAKQGAVDVRLNVWTFNESALALYRELGYDVRSLFLGKALVQRDG